MNWSRDFMRATQCESGCASNEPARGHISSAPKHCASSLRVQRSHRGRFRWNASDLSGFLKKSCRFFPALGPVQADAAAGGPCCTDVTAPLSAGQQPVLLIS
jgi:hypothetical protein